jgi:hypothetical protein
MLAAGVEEPVGGGTPALDRSIRRVGLGVLCLALSGLALASLYGGLSEEPAAGRGTMLGMPAVQACPPPCVPHVFSSAEEAMLAGGSTKGKLTLPGGDSAVQEAMKAATDANSQMDAVASSTALSDANQPVPAAAPKKTAAVTGYGGRPFVSQWDLMHGGSDAARSVSTPAVLATSTTSSADKAAAASILSHLQASAGTLRSSRGDGSSREHRRARNDDLRGDRALEREQERRSRNAELNQALRQLSKRRLRAIVRLLLKSRAASDHLSGRRGSVTELRAILDGSRRQQEEKRAAEEKELARVRRAMKELARESDRRREEDDAIAALEKRLGGSAFRGTRRAEEEENGEGRRRRRSGGEEVERAEARMDDLFQVGDDMDVEGGRRSRTSALLQMLSGGQRVDGRGEEEGRAKGKDGERSAQFKDGARAEDRSGSDEALLEKLSQLARGGRGQ